MKTTPANPMLPEAEWAFHEVDPKERHACLLHERSRGIAPGRVLYWQQKPWQDLEPNEKRFLMDLLPPPDYRQPSVRREDLSIKSGLDKTSEELQNYLKKLVKRLNVENLAKNCDVEFKLPVENVHLELDWRTSDTKLKADFKNFIRDERRRQYSAAAQYKSIARSSGTGRKRDVDRSLADIAIARAAAAGYTRLDVVKLLKELLQSFNLLGPEWKVKDGLFSEKNWAATLKKAKASFNP